MTTVNLLIEKYTKMRSNQEIVYPIEVISDLQSLKQPQQEYNHQFATIVRSECIKCGQKEVIDLDEKQEDASVEVKIEISNDFNGKDFYIGNCSCHNNQRLFQWDNYCSLCGKKIKRIK